MLLLAKFVLSNEKHPKVCETFKKRITRKSPPIELWLRDSGGTQKVAGAFKG